MSDPADLSTASPFKTGLSTTPRLFVDLDLSGGGMITLPPPASHYLTGVMRRAAGDSIRLFDDRSGEWHGVIIEPHRKATTVRLVERLSPRETVSDLWLCSAPLKRGRIDWVAEKACELGVARFVPVLTARTIVDKLNLDRLRAHMVEAAEQCGRTALPVVAEPTTLAALLSGWEPGRALIFADETGGAPLAATLAQTRAPAAILIGPEGGFTPDERAAIRALSATVPVSLGPRILRADTAAAVAVGVWQAVAGDALFC
nr:16S rRNA (uracil(1498)-N(3))-methyltransferase [Polymorphobacter sp.]